MMTSILSFWIAWTLLLSPNSSPNMDLEAVEGINAVDGFTPQELVEDIFVKGACKNIFNITSDGRPESIGYFEQGEDVIGLKEGIILATGPIDHAEGPNNDVGKGGRFGLASNDPDLKLLSNSDTIMDASVLEFDFIPLDSIVTFRYVFASEEYCEFVDNVFNDVFGFFVSGPGIDGRFSRNATNVALIPESNDYVSINTVNHKTNSNYYIGNELQADADACKLGNANPAQREKIQYDGFTQVLTAKLQLIPCETYHLKLVVADVGDDSWDSAVFLEAESFNIGGRLKLEANTQQGTDTIPEGCDYGFFNVARLEGESMEEDLTIGLRVAEASTAVEGVDFATLPDEVTIPAGRESINIPLELFIDDEFERTAESIILEFDFPCACISDTARLYVQDPLSILSGLRDQEVCVGDTVNLVTAAAGGVPGYTYQWSNGSQSKNLKTIVTEDKTIGLTITDLCGRQLQEEIELTTKRVPQARIPNEVRQTCVDDTIRIPVSFEGTPPFQFSYFLDDTLGGELTEIYQNPYYLTIGKEGLVRLASFRDAECAGEVSGGTDLRFSRIQTLATTDRVSCNGGNDGQIQLEVVGGTPPYRFDWGAGIEAVANPGNLRAGEYQVVITDANNCSKEVTVSISEPSSINPISFECRSFLADSLRISASGGTPPYLFAVDGGSYEGRELFDKLIAGDRHSLNIQDAAGCVIQQEFIVPILRQNIVELSGAILLELGEAYTLRPQLNIPESLVQSIQWTPENNLSCTDCLNPEVTALEDITYRIRIDDVFGCVDAGAIAIKLDKKPSIFIPDAFSPNGDKINDRLTVFANTDQVSLIENLQIFSRWGQEVFSLQNFAPNDEEIGWDGKVNGRNLDPGSYVYISTFVLTNGTKLQQNGTVLLMK